MKAHVLVEDLIEEDFNPDIPEAPGFPNNHLFQCKENGAAALPVGGPWIPEENPLTSGKSGDLGIPSATAAQHQ